MTFLAAAFAVVWAVTFLFILSIGARQRRLAIEMEDLQAELDQIGREQ